MHANGSTAPTRSTLKAVLRCSWPVSSPAAPRLRFMTSSHCPVSAARLANERQYGTSDSSHYAETRTGLAAAEYMPLCCLLLSASYVPFLAEIKVSPSPMELKHGNFTRSRVTGSSLSLPNSSQFECKSPGFPCGQQRRRLHILLDCHIRNS